MLLNSFNHFRAVALLFIVAGHCFELAGLKYDSFFEQIIANIILGGTALFVFISGFLFHHVFYKRFLYQKFLIGKMKNVLIPYLLLSAIPIFYLVSKHVDFHGGFFLPEGSGLFNEYIWPGLKYYWTGAFILAYWYIPFIFITFIFSPLHFVFVRLTASVQLSIVFILCVVSVFMHRPIDNLYPMQSVLYFTPVYLIGIMTSLYRDKVYKALEGKELILLFAVVALAAAQVFLGHMGSYHKSPFEYGGVDFMFIQKLALCFLFVVFLARFELYENRAVKILASTSFAVFFLHPFMVWLGIKLSHRFFGADQSNAFDSWWLYSLIVLSITLICVAIAESIHKVIPKYSRYIIGY